MGGMKTMSTREQIREYLIRLLHANKDYVTSVGDNESLVLSGRLSSLDVVDTLTFLEETFHFEMNPIGFSQAKFGHGRPHHGVAAGRGREPYGRSRRGQMRNPMQRVPERELMDGP